MAPPADRFARHPGQNSPNTHAHLPKPVQNSPNTAKIAHFGPFLARWAKIVTLKAQTPQAGRIFSRSWNPTYIGETNDTVPHPNMPPLKPLMPRCAHTQSRMQFRDRLHRRVRKNGGNSRLCHHSLKDSLGNCMRNCRAPGKTTHKTGPVIIHRPRLVCINARSACINARGYQARTERS